MPDEFYNNSDVEEFESNRKSESSRRRIWSKLTNFAEILQKPEEADNQSNQVELDEVQGQNQSSVTIDEDELSPLEYQKPSQNQSPASTEEDDFEFDVEWDSETENGQKVNIEAELDAFLSQFLTEEDETAEQISNQEPKSPIAELSNLSKRMNESLMAQVLGEIPPEERGEIIRIAYESGVRKDDPLFAVMLAMNYYERMIDQKPAQIQQLFQRWSKSWKRHLIAATGAFQAEHNRLRALIRTSEQLFQSSSQAALDQQNQAIADTVNLLVRQAALDKVSWDIYALIRAGLIILSAIGIGVAGGFVTAVQLSQRELDPKGARQLTLEQAQAMTWGMSELGHQAQANREVVAWALSPEGQWARQFMQWNQALLSKSWGRRVCEKDVEHLGVTLTLEGRVAKGGFCTLWTRSPEQRQFAK